jgi:eukaryotic-like serine/threonine-protein kinase
MASPSSTSDLISHYRLIELLGRGAMGEVWLAEDTQLPRRVAIKLLPAHLASDHEAVERLLREARAAASVDHPAVVIVHEAGIERGRPYIVMQRVEGETLEERLGRGPLPPREAVAIAAEIADALAEVHALGIVHRDLKPANVILTTRGPKVLDFGVASVQDTSRLTTTGAAVGTPAAMAPEQISGLVPDNRADLWALGVMLYEMLTGKPPFAGRSFEALAHAVLNETPPAPGISPDLDYLVLKLLRKDPTQRYARAEDVLADLAAARAALERPTGGPSLVAEPAGPPRLAVLYFEVLSAEPDDAFVAAGLTEDLIVDLARVQAVRVASRAEVVPFRDRTLPPRTLARELSADYLVQGSVRRAGNRARISAQLVRASDGHTLWAERYDRTLEDLFDVQADVSKRIVDALQLVIRPEERELLDRAPTRDPQAYALYLRARQLIDGGTREQNRNAEELLKTAIERDPSFAQALGALAEVHAERAWIWWTGEQDHQLALEFASRALALDPTLIEPLFARASVGMTSGDQQMGLEAVQEILRRDSANARAMEWAVFSELMLGRPEEALPPALEMMKRYPDLPRPVIHAATATEILGRMEESKSYRRQALERCTRWVEKHPDDGYMRSLFAGELAIAGAADAAIEQSRQARALAPEDLRVQYNSACTLARLGRPEEAMEILGNTFSSIFRPNIIEWPRRDPDLRTLWDRPDFQAFWRPSGAKPEAQDS